MKKFLVVALVLMAFCMATAAYALDVTVNGEVGIRTRWLVNAEDNPQPDHTQDGNNRFWNQTRYLLEVNVKADNNIKGKLSIWNDFDRWDHRTFADSNDGQNKGSRQCDGAGDSCGQVSSLVIREAFIDFMIPGIPVGVKIGRMNQMIGQGWFERSMFGGESGVVVYVPIGKSVVKVQRITVWEGDDAIQGDNSHLYSLIGVFKPSDDVTVGADLSYLKDSTGQVLITEAGGRGNLWNLGLNWNVKAGIASIKGQIDVQNGRATTTAGSIDYRGYQGVLQVAVNPKPVDVHMMLGYGSGNKGNNGAGSSNIDQIITMMDSNQHYTLVYEYRLRGAASRVPGGTNYEARGLANTLVVSAGAAVDVVKSLKLGADVYYLQANQPVSLNGAAEFSRDLGWEFDLKAIWKIAPNLTWNWQLGYLATGAAYRNTHGATDDAFVAQGVLTLKF